MHATYANFTSPYSPDDVSVELRGVPPGLAITIAELVKPSEAFAQSWARFLEAIASSPTRPEHSPHGLK